MQQTTYNLELLEKNAIKQCFEENPRKNIRQIADLLGISERNLYRKMKDLKISTKSTKAPKKLVRAIAVLEGKGYRGFC